MLVDARNEGYQDYHHGKSYMDCPYENLTDGYYSWIDGWWNAWETDYSGEATGEF